MIVNDLPHGCGSERLSGGPSVEKYHGFFVLGRRHGIGQILRQDFEYEGYWREGHRTGYGKESYKTDYTYFGTFIKGVKEGIGEVIYRDGSEYVG